ncbi:HAD hydrolase-like protein [Microbacterium mangrovi]|uniref:HAD hydrolase-like protein n=1 Tax=Microbacterium mangrovi TaxID=1348253 RepID=UPI00068F9262|nr:HAD hydrolase-like protein [Microbacterium mangrovi]
MDVASPAPHRDPVAARSIRSPWTCILWDVDGTLIDASEGILRRLKTTLEHFGHPPVREAELAHWIGPPMLESFQVMAGMDAVQAEAAVTYYRQVARADGYETGARVYPGMADLLRDIHAAGIPQATASSKPEDQVLRLMQHFGLDGYLDRIVGATSEARDRGLKAEVLADSLRRLQALGVDVSRPVLIGDRHHDVEGGAELDVPVIFNRWGFGWPHEADGAAASVDSADQLRALLLVGDD